MANIKIAQLTNQTAISDTDLIIVETATSTNKMTIGKLKELLGIQSGGIVESGSNANGNYIKFANGTLICTGTITTEASSTNTIPSGGYRTSAHIRDFPHPFTGTPKITCSMGDGNNDSISAMVASYPPSPTTQCYAQWRTINSQVAVTRNVDYIAVGMWI